MTEGSINKSFRFPLLGIRNAPAQMQKWFNTTYGFVMGIAAAALSIGVISAATVGIVIGSMALIVYTHSHTKANSCIRKIYLEVNKDNAINDHVGLTMEQVNKCRAKQGLSKLTMEEVYEGSKYPQYLDWIEPSDFEKNTP